MRLYQKRTLRRLAGFFGLLVVLSPGALQAARVAVVAGNNVGMADEIELRYAERDAMRVAKALVDLGGFASIDLHLLTGSDAAGLTSTLARLRGGSAPETLFFYYSGHADGHSLHLAGTRLSFAELRQALAATGARVSILLVDSCKSGALTRAKGARLGPAFAIDVAAGLHDPELEGQIVITSSAADEVSQESDQIEGSFFTHNWVSGIYGAADVNGDALVTLEEAYRHAHYRTVEQTIQSQGGVQHPSYRFTLSGQGNVVLANLARSTATVRLLPGETSGAYFILDTQKRLVLVELTPSRSGETTIRLPPGRYRLRKREKRRFLIADFTAQEGAVVTVADTDMEAVTYRRPGEKGVEVIIDTTGAVRSHGPDLRLGVRNGIFWEMSPTWSVAGGYRIGWENLRLLPRLVYRQAFYNQRGSFSSALWLHSEFDFGLEAGWAIFVEPFELVLGIDLGLVFFDRVAVTRTNAVADPALPAQGILALGLHATAVVEAALELGSGVTGTVFVASGVALFERAGLQVSPVVLGGLGLRYELGE